VPDSLAPDDALSLADSVPLRDRERWLALLWAPAEARPALLALAAYDLEQGRLVAAAREPMLAQIRLAWWRDQLLALAGGAPPPPQPILQALVHDAAPRGVDLAALAAVEDGHQPLLWDDPGDLAAVAAAWGGPLFAAMATAIAGAPLTPAADAAARQAGTRWAASRLWRDLGLDAPDTPPPAGPLPPTLRGLLALAEADLARAARGKRPRRAASPGRQLRLAWAAMRGRDQDFSSGGPV